MEIDVLLNDEKVMLMSMSSTDRLELGGAFWGYFGRRKYLNPIFERCTGCKLCEYACVKYHYGNVVNQELSRVRVHLIYPGPMAIPIQCSSCVDSIMLSANPVTKK